MYVSTRFDVVASHSPPCHWFISCLSFAVARCRKKDEGETGAVYNVIYIILMHTASASCAVNTVASADPNLILKDSAGGSVMGVEGLLGLF